MSPFKSLMCAFVLGIMAAPTLAADTPAPAPAALTDAQKAAVEEVVRNLLIKKEPDIIIKAAQEVQNRQEAETNAKSQEALTTYREKIYNDPNAPVAGNPKGNVTVVEFYDYQCGYCKISVEAIQKLLAEDKNVKLIYKEFPILGPNSVLAAKISLASIRQGKFIKFHDALMSDKEHLSEEGIFKIAKSVGLDVEKLKKDMADPAIEKMIKENQTLGSDIGAHGTPTFVIGDQVYPGAMQYDSLKKAVEDARAEAKAPAKK